MRKILITFLLATSCASVSFTASAAELVRKADESQSFFERYTNAAQDVILQGLKLVGVRYRFGGAQLPRTAAEMSQVGERIDTSQLKPGDLVFFNTMRRTFSHVGIYLGDSHFLHAPRTGAEVRVESMEDSYWIKRYNGARRIIEGN